ncbi:MAG TPA: PilZ domain-containing protein [Terracidiphilus sp.]|nr:PilZ domain-containing protein [Terracidiphilus sp.]
MPAEEKAGESNSTFSKNDSPVEIRRVECLLSESLFKRLLRKIFPDQRKQERISVPPLVGYLGTMRASEPYGVGDISLSGFCLVTDERWTPGTEMPITLQRTNVLEKLEDDCFTVQATVVRSADDGVAFSILLSEEESIAVDGNPLKVKWASAQEMWFFLERLKSPDETKPASDDREGARNVGASLKAAFGPGHPAWIQSAGD